MHKVSLQVPELRLFLECHCDQSANGTTTELLVPVEVVPDTVSDGWRFEDTDRAMDDALVLGQFFEKQVVRFLPEAGEMHHRDIPVVEEARQIAGQVPREGRVSDDSVPRPLLIESFYILCQ